VAGDFMISFSRAVPVIPAKDVAESAEFFKRLGFSVATPMENYAIVERDSAEIHLTKSLVSAPERTGCYLVVTDIDAMHSELVSKGVGLQPPIRQPWGLREMYVVDPSGNLIRFAEGAESTV
jgi:catechol 2,3-dioxygenase-like lactoylglutathione lyase family enzyme